MTALNAHEAPPESLKAIFKKYQKLLPTDLNDDEGHLDFSKSVLSLDLKQTGQLTTAELLRAFQRFVVPEDAYSCGAAPIYASEKLPGRSNQLLLANHYRTSIGLDVAKHTLFSLWSSCNSTIRMRFHVFMPLLRAYASLCEYDKPGSSTSPPSMILEVYPSAQSCRTFRRFSVYVVSSQHHRIHC